MVTKFLDYTGLSYLWNKIKAWCNATFMHLNLDEVVTGVKTYNINNQFSKSKYTDIVRGTTPSTNHYSYHEFLDKNGDKLGYIAHSYSKTGTVNTYLSISRQDGAQEASLGVGYLANGNTYSWAPVPDNSSNSEEIATTSFVKAQGYITSSDSITGNAATATKIHQVPSGTTYVAAVTAGNALVNSSATSFGAVWNAPTKNYRVGMATYPSSNDKIIWYSVTNADVSAGINTAHESMRWDGDTGILEATGFSGPLTGNVTGNCSGTSANVTGIVAIANGGTGADTRIGAIKSLLSSRLNNPDYVFTLNSTGSNPWSNAGYTSISTLKAVMGVDASDLVHTSGDEQISGLKTFYNNVHMSHNSLGGGFVVKQRGITRGGTWKAQRGHYLFYDSVDKPLADVVNYTYTSSSNTNVNFSNLQFVIYAPFSAADADSYYLMFGTSSYTNTNSWGSITFIPSADNTVYLGTANNRWKQLFAGTTTISTSDERCKDSITNIPDEILDIWENINWKQFYFKNAIAEKGNNARLHSGLIAQDIQKVFFEANLDASRYGFFCYDEWDEEPEEYDENGKLIKKYVPSGNRYSLRYEEALCIEAAYQRRKNKILENRISELEKRLARLEGTV